LKPAVTGRRRESQSGPAKAVHNEAAAQTLLLEGLKQLGMAASQLEELPKSAPEKAVLAWWLRQCTTVSLQWLSEHLAMGHFTRVSQAVSQVKRRPTRQQAQLQRRLRDLSSIQTP